MQNIMLNVKFRTVKYHSASAVLRFSTCGPVTCKFPASKKEMSLFHMTFLAAKTSSDLLGPRGVLGHAPLKTRLKCPIAA